MVEGYSSVLFSSKPEILLLTHENILSENLVDFTLIELTSGTDERERRDNGRQGTRTKFIVIGNLIKHAAINVD
jgi:hypothetical protein